MAVIVPAAIAAAIGIYKVAEGAHEKSQAKKLAATNRPVYNIPQSDYNNLSIAQSMAGQGLSDGSKQILLDNADRGLATSVSAVLQGGGNPNDVGGIYKTYLDNLSNVAVYDNQMKVKNMDTLLAANYRMSDQTDKQWQINNWGPYADKLKAAAQLRAMGSDSTNSGLSTVASAAMSVGSGLQQRENTQKIIDAGNQPKQNNGTSDDGLKTAALLLNARQAGYTNANNGVSGKNAYGIIPPADDGPYTPPSMNGSGGAGYKSDGSYMGLDLSKLNANDAMMVQKLLYGKY